MFRKQCDHASDERADLTTAMASEDKLVVCSTHLQQAVYTRGDADVGMQPSLWHICSAKMQHCLCCTYSLDAMCLTSASARTSIPPVVGFTE